MYFYFRLIPNFNSDRVKKQIHKLGKKFYKTKKRQKRAYCQIKKKKKKKKSNNIVMSSQKKKNSVRGLS